MRGFIKDIKELFAPLLLPFIAFLGMAFAHLIGFSVGIVGMEIIYAFTMMAMTQIVEKNEKRSPYMLLLLAMIFIAGCIAFARALHYSGTIDTIEEQTPIACYLHPPRFPLLTRPTGEFIHGETVKLERTLFDTFVVLRNDDGDFAFSISVCDIDPKYEKNEAIKKALELAKEFD
jgi:hypothetical protein